MSYEGQLARGLGWFSIGLGTAQALTPRALGRLIGVGAESTQSALMRLIGLREIAAGVAILFWKRPTPVLWGRVAGDAMDLALLGAALRSGSNGRGRVAAAIGAVGGVTALDVLCSRAFSEQPGLTTSGEADVRVTRSIIVGSPVDEVYAFWHDFENLPRFMDHLESVRVTGDGRSHWVARGPAATVVEWDAEVIEDRPNELIAWRSLPGADVSNAGSARFTPAPGERGTMVTIQLSYDPPAGIAGIAVARLFRDEPGQQVEHELRAFKQMMELGEVVQSDATAAGGHPAQPMGAGR
jgi:uncharacterized membrane protein